MVEAKITSNNMVLVVLKEILKMSILLVGGDKEILKQTVMHFSQDLK